MPLWGDEVMLALNFLDRPLTNIFDPLENAQVVPPFFILWNWIIVQYLGTSEWLLRALPMLASVSALILMYHFVKKTLTTDQALIAVSLLAVSYYTVRYGAEFKPYSIDLLMALVVLFIGYQFHQSPNNNLHKILFISVLPTATFISFPVVFVVGSVMLALFVDCMAHKDYRRLAIVTITGGLVLMLFWAHYVYFIHIHSAANASLKVYWKDAFPPADIAGFVLWFTEQSSGRILAYPHGGGNYKSLLTTVLVLTGINVLWHQKREFLLMILVLPFLLTVLAAIFHAYPYGISGRIAQHLAPSICILAAVGLTFIFGKVTNLGSKQHSYVKYTCFILLSFGVLGIGYSIAKPYKTKDDSEVRRIVTSMYQDYDCDRINVPNESDHVPVNFRWYLNVSDGAVFNAKTITESSFENGTFCMLYFDSSHFPVFTSRLNRQLQTLKNDSKIILDTENPIYLYGKRRIEHTYRQIVLNK